MAVFVDQDVCLERKARQKMGRLLVFKTVPPSGLHVGLPDHVNKLTLL